MIKNYRGESVINELAFKQNERFSITQMDYRDDFVELLEEVMLNKKNTLKVFEGLKFFQDLSNRRHIANFSRATHVNDSNDYNFYSSKDNYDLYEKIVEVLQDIEDRLAIQYFKGKRIYIPTLRTAHSLFK